MLRHVIVEFEAPLWLWTPRTGEPWTFISLPAEASDDIRELTAGPRRGFGAVKVRAEIGDSKWETSIFPESKSGCYVLPVKRPIRKAQDIEAGDTVTVKVEVL